MIIKAIRILPPLAFARFGAAEEPLANYTVDPDPEAPLGFRAIQGADTLVVAQDGTLRITPAAEINARLRDDRANRRDELIAALRNGPDFELAIAIEDVADVLDALHERILGDGDIAPDVIDQLALADQPAAVPGEIGQHIE